MLEKLLAKRHISHLDLSSVGSKLVEKLGWSPAQAEQIELEYRRFLYALTRKRPEDFISPPTPEVDEFWHQHILDTRKYRKDCKTVFGQFMDHTPGLGGQQQVRADTRRREIYAEHDIDATWFDFGDSSSSASFFGSGESHHSHVAHHGSDHGSDASGHDGGGHGSGDSGAGDGGGGDGGGGSCAGGCSGS
jgi:uncharacterized membrane protein YgcG